MQFFKIICILLSQQLYFIKCYRKILFHGSIISSKLESSLYSTTSTSLTNKDRINSPYLQHLHISEYPNDDYSHILGYNESIKEMLGNNTSEIPKLTKLQEISKLKISEVIKNKTPIDTQGCGIDRSFYISSDDYYSEIREFDEIHGKPINLKDRLLSLYPKMAIAAEFKRASPSKGDINVNLDAVTQCLQYAEVGAAVISVLTEFRHFKGTIEDMRQVRLATQSKLGPNNRPAILRKDFIFDRYQILEARANGADTVLLIVAVLGVNQLKDLIDFSRAMNLEPLVEVHTDREMEIALDCGAKVIGVNNRNLHTFQLDLDTTSRILKIAEKRNIQWKPSLILNNKSNDKNNNDNNVCIAALSGITSSDDVNEFRRLGISCCLIGETLMKSNDLKATISELLSGDNDENSNNIHNQSKKLLVKTCGITMADDASIALQSGANFIGLIFANNSPRKITSIQQANEIVNAVQKYGERNERISLMEGIEILKRDKLTTKLWYARSLDFLRKITLRKPLVVGVFQDQPIEEVNEIIIQANLDLVQLHGEETPEYTEKLLVPCIKVIHIPIKSKLSSENKEQHFEKTEIKEYLVQQLQDFKEKAVAVILDSRIQGQKGGGTGEVFDWSLTDLLDGIPIILAGGLSPSNVINIKSFSGILGVDVSSGIEVNGKPGIKDQEKINLFFNHVNNNQNTSQ
eukprot:gene13558-18195_t